MLYLLASLFFAGASAQATCLTGATGMTQSGDNNYVIDAFTTSTLLFTYAINQCTAVSISDSSTYYMYTCSKDDNDMWWVTKSSYTTPDCSGTAEDSTSWDETTATEGQTGYFKCDGKNNYASIKISIDSQCAGAITVAGGLGACASNPSAYDTKFYCDSSSALVELYLNPAYLNNTYSMCDDDHLYCNKWTFGSTCKPAASLFGTTVYGTFSDCAVSESGNDDDDSGSDSSASSQFTLLGLVVALIVNFFH